MLQVTGARWGLETLVPDGADVIKLPSYVGMTEDNVLTRRPKLNTVNSDQLVRLRSDILLLTVRTFDPDIILVDHLPLGLLGELKAVIKDRRRQGRTQMVLGLRGVIRGHDLTAAFFSRSSGFSWTLRNEYDHLLVYTDPRVIDLASEFDLSRRLAGKMHYCGYVTRLSAEPEATLPVATSPAIAPDGVIVNAGGGSEAEATYSRILDALIPLANRTGLHATVVWGPYLGQDSVDRLTARRLPASIKTLRVYPRLDTAVRKARLFIGHGGYNTLAGLVAGRTPAVILPRETADGEQLEHARRLEAIGYCRTVSPDADARELTAAIEATLSSTHARPAINLGVNGAENTANWLASIV